METKPLTLTQDLRGHKILVTGASGFIGSHLCRRLGGADNEVHAVSRAKRSNDTIGPRWWQGDLTDSTSARALLDAIKPDIVFHLASQVLGARGLEHVMPTFRNTLMTTINVLIAAAETGCRRIVLSNSLEEPNPNDVDAVPCSPYAAAKWASSGYARMFHALYHLPVVILRVFMVYGPAQQDLAKLIPYVTLCLLRGERLTLTSGQRQVDWIYVDDVVDALVAAAHASDVEGSTIDVGSGDLVSVRGVVEQLISVSNTAITPVFGDLAERPLEQVRVANVAHTYAKIGWSPKTPLREGLERTFVWYREQLSGRNRNRPPSRVLNVV